MNAPGRGLLKISGILLIILGSLQLLLGLLSIAGIFMPGVIEAAAEQAGTTAEMVIIGAVVLVILGAIYLVAGILGVKNCDKPEKVQVCFVVGVIMILIVIVSAGMDAMAGNLKWYNILIGLVFPVLYLLGAIKNKEALVGVADVVDSDER